MRRVLPPVLLLIMLFLAACGGTPAPTTTPELPTAAPTAVVPTQPPLDVFALPTGLAEPLDVQAAGTMSVAEVEENGVVVTRVPYTINVVSFYQQGGVTGTTTSIVLYGDGRLIRNGVESQVDAGTVARMGALLEVIHFLDIQGIFDLGGAGTDQFRYTVTLETPEGSRTLTTVDGLTPPELYELYEAMKALGQ